MSYLTYSEAPLFFRLNKSIIPYALDHFPPCHIDPASKSSKPYVYINNLCCYTTFRLIKMIRPENTFMKNYGLIRSPNVYNVYRLFDNSDIDNVVACVIYQYDENYTHVLSYIKKDNIIYKLESNLSQHDQRIQVYTIDDLFNEIVSIKLRSENYYSRFGLFPLPSDKQLQINHNLIVQNSSPIYPLTTLLLNTS